MRERLARLDATSWLTIVTLALATLSAAIPFLHVVWLPLVDYPQHLGTIAAIHGANDPHVGPFFETHLARSQYLALYLLGDGLAYPFGVEGAGRATAILSTASLPLAVAYFLRGHGRPAWLGAGAAPIALHAYVFWGFLNYAAGMTTALLALGAFARLAYRTDAKRVAIAAALALLCFYTHAQLYAWFALAAVLQWVAIAIAERKVALAQPLRALVGSAVAALPSIVGAVVWVRLSGVIEHGEAGARSGHAAEVVDAPAIFVSPIETLHGWLGHSFGMYTDGGGEIVALAFFASMLTWAALRGARAIEVRSAHDETPIVASPSTGWRRHLLDRPARVPTASYAPELALALSFVLYFAAPFSYRLIEPINHRFLPLALALLPVLGPRTAVRLPTQIFAAVIALAAASIATVTHVRELDRTDAEMGDLASALDVMEPGRRTLGLMFDKMSNVISLPIYLHVHQYYQARRGGLACFSFVEFPKSPVSYRPGAEPPPFPPRFEWTPEAYRHDVYGDAFDYWLVRHGEHRPSPDVFRGVPEAERPQPIMETDRFTVFAHPRLAGTP